MVVARQRDFGHGVAERLAGAKVRYCRYLAPGQWWAV
jgi:hypothetical protein